jgi:hypothetical protein
MQRRQDTKHLPDSGVDALCRVCSPTHDISEIMQIVFHICHYLAKKMIYEYDKEDNNNALFAMRPDGR